jgi:HK97 gp10 family phage protein
VAASSTLEGVAALTRQLQALGKLEDGKALRSAVKAGIAPALKYARTIVPVGTKPFRTYQGLLVNAGFLKTQLRTISTINSAKNIASGILGVRKAGYYGVKFVEFGTRKMSAQPWIRRALLEARAQCEEAFRASIAKSVDKAAKTT